MPALTVITFLCALAAEIWVYHHHAHRGKRRRSA